MSADAYAALFGKAVGELHRRDAFTVSALLAAEQVVGTRNSARYNPLAQFLHRRTGQPVIVVGAYATLQKRVDDDYHMPLQVMRLPDAAYRFLREFDGGAYPQLAVEGKEEDG